MSDQSVNTNSKSPVVTASIVVIAIVAVLSFVLCFVPLSVLCKRGSEGDGHTYCAYCSGTGWDPKPKTVWRYLNSAL